MVQGAVTEGWPGNLLDVLKTGDRIRLDPQSRTLTVLD